MFYLIPGLVTDEDCADYLVNRGKGWVCESNGEIVGFAIADLYEDNIWALFVNPDFEKQGIGRKLHEIMMDWYFSQRKRNRLAGHISRHAGRFILSESRLERRQACMVRVK